LRERRQVANYFFHAKAQKKTRLTFRLWRLCVRRRCNLNQLCTTNASNRGIIVQTSFLHEKSFRPAKSTSRKFNSTTQWREPISRNVDLLSMPFSSRRDAGSFNSGNALSRACAYSGGF